MSDFFEVLHLRSPQVGVIWPAMPWPDSFPRGSRSPSSVFEQGRVARSQFPCFWSRYKMSMKLYMNSRSPNSMFKPQYPATSKNGLMRRPLLEKRASFYTAIKCAKPRLLRGHRVTSHEHVPFNATGNHNKPLCCQVQGGATGKQANPEPIGETPKLQLPEQDTFSGWTNSL